MQSQNLLPGGLGVLSASTFVNYSEQNIFCVCRCVQRVVLRYITQHQPPNALCSIKNVIYCWSFVLFYVGHDDPDPRLGGWWREGWGWGRVVRHL